jgi:hypothetical protein
MALSPAQQDTVTRTVRDYGPISATSAYNSLVTAKQAMGETPKSVGNWLRQNSGDNEQFTQSKQGKTTVYGINAQYQLDTTPDPPEEWPEELWEAVSDT